jgi:hypothetical protein
MLAGMRWLAQHKLSQAKPSQAKTRCENRRGCANG